MTGEGFRVVQADIRETARRMQDASEGVNDADPSADVDDLSTIMPGSQSASVASTLSTTWKERFSGWSKDASNQHDKLNAAANNYDASDHEAAQRYRYLATRSGQQAR